MILMTGRADYEWARGVFSERLRHKPNATLFSPSHDDLPPAELAGWILDDGLPVRLQLQAHKYIWGAQARGV
jgi:7-carboxy-7-deazaguanine synthase